MSENELTKVVVDTAFQIHMKLRPGLLESAYQTILLYELRKRELIVHDEVGVPVDWEGSTSTLGFGPT
jgi:GxxExxY protein